MKGSTQTVLGPWSLSADAHLTKISTGGSGGRTTASVDSAAAVPSLQAYVRSEQLNLSVGPNLVLAAEVARKRLEAFEKSTKDGGASAPPEGPKRQRSQVISRPRTPLEQHYKDDLRAGAFQYVTNESSTTTAASEPKPYQVVFGSRPPTMTWRYPQPRQGETIPL